MISFVYFDVGGVVVDDFSGNHKWQELKQELGIDADHDAAFEEVWARYASDICIDRDIEALLPILVSECKLQLPKDYSLLHGFVSRFYANPPLWPILTDLRAHTRIGLLTNMYPGMFAAIQKQRILPDIIWDEVIDSSVERLQKPDKRLFERAQHRANVPGAGILFVDNSPEHISAAQTLGWQTFLYNPANHEESCATLAQFLNQQS